MIETETLGRDSRAICERLDRLIEIMSGGTAKKDSPSPKTPEPKTSLSDIAGKKE